VLVKLLNACSGNPALRQAACNVVRSVLQPGQYHIICVDTVLWESAFRLYAEGGSGAWSFVDRLSVILCREARIHRVFTHDRHFGQADFAALLTGSA
jgi:predicted nucleic acid-binding protein